MSLLIRLTGSESEIAYTLTALKSQGYEWKGDCRRYPKRDDASKFSCYLNDVIAPSIIPVSVEPIAQSDDPQPRPWDAVIGGKGRASSQAPRQSFCMLSKSEGLWPS